MTTYRFCVAPGGTLVCYKVNNGFIKFTGNYAKQLLEHIKGFSFYTFNSNNKKENNKYTYDISFENNNHQVIFEDVHKMKKKEDISIENEIKELVNIVKENNNIQKENELQENKKEKISLIKKKVKTIVYATTICASLLITNEKNTKTVKAETTDETLNNITPIEQQLELLTPNAIQTNTNTTELNPVAVPPYTGPVLTKQAGIIHNGPASGDETYYDLNMTRVVNTMRANGFDELNFPYWVREDGVKMLGNFVMVAANLQVHPRGSIVQTSLGTGLVCDTGKFAKTNKLKLDIATSWTKGR